MDVFPVAALRGPFGGCTSFSFRTRRVARVVVLGPTPRHISRALVSQFSAYNNVCNDKELRKKMRGFGFK